MLNLLVKLRQKESIVTSNIIAEEFGRNHNDVLKSIRELINSGHLGLGEFSQSSYINSQNKAQPCYTLTERGFLIAMPFIGGKKAKDGQVKLIDAFMKMRAIIDGAKIDRNIARCDYKSMTNALKNVLKSKKKVITPKHFCDEADLINRIALGMTAKEYRTENNIKNKSKIRDNFTPAQINCIAELQVANTLFLKMDKDYNQRLADLTNLFEKYHKQALLDEKEYILLA